MTSITLDFLNEISDQSKLGSLDLFLAKARASSEPVLLTDESANLIIGELESPAHSNLLLATLCRALPFLSENKILHKYCENLVLSNSEKNLFKQDSALQYLIKANDSESNSMLIERVFSSGNYLMEYTAAVQIMPKETLRALKKLVDISILRDPYDHGVYEGVTFWIAEEADESLIPYIQEKINLSTDQGSVDELSSLIDLILEK
jgi:hypothetical protein